MQQSVQFEGMQTPRDISREAKDFLISYLAYKMNYAKHQECKEILKKILPKPKDQNTLLDEMKESGEIEEDNRGYGQMFYRLPVHQYLDLLWELTETQITPFLLTINRYKEFSWGAQEATPLRNVLMEWKNNGKIIPYNWEELKLNNLILPILESIHRHNHWSTILKDIDFKSFIALAHINYCNIILSVDSAEIKMFKDHYVDNKRHTPATQAIIDTYDLFFKYVLSGNISNLPDHLDANNHNYLYAQALQLQYQKDYNKAILAYRKAIKAEKRREASSNPFYTLMLILALDKDKKVSSKNRLLKIFEFVKTEYNHDHNSENIAPLILLCHILDIKSNCIDYLINAQDNHAPIDLALSVMVIMHYRLRILPEDIIAKAEKIINHDQLSLLQLEASSLPLFKDKQTTLNQQLGLEPIFEVYHKLHAWEKNINDINSIIEINSPRFTRSTVNVSSSRIIYLLDNAQNFHPRLQKSRDGKTWSNGRNVALSNFSRCSTEGMTELDRIVAAKVTCYESWGIGKTYELSDIKLFTILTNHPDIYSYSNPAVSIQIINDTPYVQIKQDEKGYYITSNIAKLENVNTIVCKDSDVLYRVFELTTLQRNIIQMFKKQPFYPLEAKQSLSDLIVNVAPIITVHSDIMANTDKLKSIEGSSRITVQILPVSEGVKVELFVKPLEDTHPYCKVADGKETCIAMYKDEKVLVKRNLKKEQKNYATINTLLVDILSDNTIEDSAMFEDLYDCLDLIERLQEHDKIARVEWPKGAKVKIKGYVDYSKFNISIKEKGSWFEVNGEVKVDKNLQLSLAELLEKNRNSKGHFIELTNNEFIAISNDLRKKLNDLDANMSIDKGTMYLSSFSTIIVNDLEQEGVKVKKDNAFKSLQSRMEAAEKLSITVPSTLKAELRDYQLDGYKWLSRLSTWGAGACLADDMGLGKTVQAIALLLSRASNGASLIVAPASVLHNWKNELARFAPTLNCKMLHDNVSQRSEIVNTAGKYDIVVSSYGLLSTITDTIKAKKWNIMLLDEAHNIKNKDTKISKVAMQLSGEFRLLLTGTPIQNHLGEIWNLFQFTNPGLLGTFNQFNTKFIIPIERDKDKTRQKQLKSILQPFMLRRTKSEVLDELPGKTEIMHRVELSDMERAFYENIRQQAIANMEESSYNSIQTLSEITKLRQAACHPMLLDNTIPYTSSKINRLLELIDELTANNHRALVFSQFRLFLKLVEKELKAKGIPYLYLDGTTSLKERERLANDFQHGESPIFLISLKAGGTGLNLTAADYVIHLDPWWNPAIEDQASDRTHRIGQTRPVTIYKFIADQTIEETIVELHKSKKSLADSLLEGSNMAHKLTKEEILALLKNS